MVDVCKLTGESGKYVASHLIPKALTKPEQPGLSFLEAGKGLKPIRRHSSWYDNRLVTSHGEKILSDIDDWAIKKLRYHHLVWSGWGPIIELPDINPPRSDWGFRILSDTEWPRLLLFFLSLLWRAAASSRKEFSDVNLPAEDIERLREMVVSGSVEPKTFYPVQIIQLSTVGKIHNQTPFKDIKTIPASNRLAEYQVPIIRFYFDGLIAHFDMRSHEEIESDDLGDLFLGATDYLLVTTVSYESSFQRENLELIMGEADKF